MTKLDTPERGPLVVHVVYDGAPFAGKTTSMRELSRAFGAQMHTPVEKVGRTVFFDWLEHRAGVFDGELIKLHVVSVPGQPEWAERRAYLIRRADVVVFVGDTTSAGWAASEARFVELRRELASRPSRPPVVFQANMRDKPDLVPLDTITRFVGDFAPIVETSALDGTGIRFAFVSAVGLAVRRHREAGGALRDTHDEPFDAPDTLLARLTALEASARGMGPRSPSAPPPKLSETAEGMLWPPLEGRALLEEATADDTRLGASHEGARAATLGEGFRVHSAQGWLYDDPEDARAALLACAKTHGRLGTLLSPGRCLVVVPTEDGRFRLWQISRRFASLRDLFFEDGAAARSTADRVVATVLHVHQAHAAAAARDIRLSIGIDTVGLGDTGVATFVGVVPVQATAAGDEDALVERLAWEIEPLLVNDESGSAREEALRQLARATDATTREFARRVVGGVPA